MPRLVVRGSQNQLLQSQVYGLPQFLSELSQLTKSERVGMRLEIRKNNRAASEMVVKRAKELVPVSDRPRPPTKHLKGAIRNVSTDKSIKIVAGNKNVWWGWIVHAGADEITWEHRGRRYPPGQPFLRDAVEQTWPAFIKLHQKGQEKVVANWNRRQRKAFATGGRI